MRHSSLSKKYFVALALAITLLFQPPSGFAASSDRADRSPRPDGAFPSVINHSDMMPPPASVDRDSKAGAIKNFNRLPLRFEINAGQTDPQVKYLSRGPGYILFLTPAEAVLKLRNTKSARSIPTNSQSTVRMKLVNARTSPKMEGLEALPSKSNYFLGNDPGKWRRDVTSYAKVRYKGVYPGIDMIYYGHQQQLEYDFVVAPHANPGAIRLRFDGIERIEMEPAGDLILHTADGEVRQHKPVVYQERTGGRQAIAGRYAIKSEREVGFELGEYDLNRPLIIDPILAYSTFLGGTGDDTATAVATDAAGNAYVTGLTNSMDFPTVNPLKPDPDIARSDCFVAKLNREGTALLYSTYFGGSDIENPRKIALDGQGNILLMGDTASKDFPTKNPIQPASGNAPDVTFINDIFVTKLNREGSELIFSTYLGGVEDEMARDLALDHEGNVYITGATFSNNFPTRNALQPALAGDSDAFVAKLNATGSALVYSTYLGGTVDEEGNALAADRNGNVYIVGSTSSEDFPTANPLQPALKGLSDAFITKLDPNGSSILYSTYFGGSDIERGKSMALDGFGNIFVVGDTLSSDLTLKNPVQDTFKGVQDTFIAKFNPSGSALRYSTYLGGGDYDEVWDMAVDREGKVYLVGHTYSRDFPTLDAIQPIPDNLNQRSPAPHAFLSVLNVDCSGLVYSTYLGGRDLDGAFGISLDAMGDVYVVGVTQSEDFPTTPGTFQRRFIGPVFDSFSLGDAFVVKIVNRRPSSEDDDDR